MNPTPTNQKDFGGLQQPGRFRFFFTGVMSVLFALLGANALIAQVTYTSTTAGNWSTVTWSPAGTPGPADNVIINTNVTANVVVDIATLTVNAGRTLTISSQDFSVSGATSISGIMIDNNGTGSNTFAGTLTVNAGGTFNCTANSDYLFGGNLINNGTFTKGGAGTSTFDQALSLSGSSTFSFTGNMVVNNDAIVTSTATVNVVSGTLNGSNAGSTWVNGAGASLDYKNVNAPMTSGVLDASGLNNTVSYTGTSQTIRAASYHHLTLGGSGTKTVPDVNIAGNLTRTAAITFTATTVTFDSSNPGVYSFAANQAFPNIVINKPGGTLTFAASGTRTTTATSITIAAGTLNMGTTATTITNQGDLSGAGALNMAGAAHTLNLGGETNAIASLVTAAGSGSSTINYNRAGDQTLLASLNCKSITLSGSGDKTLSGGTFVDGVLNFAANVRLILGDNSIKLTAASTLLPTTLASWTASRMVVTEGQGRFVKEATSVAHITTNLPGGRFPVGSNGYFTPMSITSLAASFSGTGSVAVRAVPERQPNIPYYNNALIKNWDVETSNMSAITATVAFNFSPAEVIGSVALYVPRVWDGSTLATPASPSAPGSNPFSSTGTSYLTGQWSAFDPTIRTSLYSYQSGDWADPNTWTTDPSGSTLVSPIVPGPGDQVVILNGRTVTTAVGRTVGQLTIQEGGVLDIGTTTPNDFGVVDGKGTLKLASVSFPTGSFTQFVAASGGTVEYYNLPAGTNALASTQTTYNNLVVSSSNAVSYTLTMPNSNLTLNGNLSVQKSSTGTPSFNIGGTTGNRTLNVFGNVTVNQGCSLGVEVYNGAHTFNVYGNLTVNGTIDLQNGAAYANSANGEAVIVFYGATTNTTATFGASAVADFYDFRVNKNEGYELFVTASPSSTVGFNGAGATINPISGTLRLGANINVPVLNGPSGGNFDIGAPGVLPTLWIDGATVTDGGLGGAIVPYGTLRVTAGTLNLVNGQRSIVLRESGFFKIDGGTVNMGLFRTSVTAVTHRGSFEMTGGTLNLLGNGTVNYYAVFSLPYPENVFSMSGGTINITKVTTGGITPTGGILIASTPQNYSVTGGTVNVQVTGNFLFDISSTAPFYNMNISQVSAGTGKVRLADINWSYDGSAGNTATAVAQSLVVLNNLTMVSGNTPYLETNENDIVVGGNCTVGVNCELKSGSNSLVFNGNAAQSFTVNGILTVASSGGSSFINGPENIVNGSNYTLERLTSAQNVELSPIGTMTAERLMETTANGNHRFYTPFIPTSGPVTASIFVKPNGRSCVSLQLGSFTNLAIARFNLTGGGTVTSTNGLVISAGISAEAGGWYRIWATSNGASDYRMRLYLGNGSCADSYAGSTSNGIYAWGAKVESGSVATPYVSSSGTGINSLEVNKATGSTVTISGSITSLNVNGNLRVNTGILDIQGKTVNVAGNIVNNTMVQGTTASKLRLFGTSTQSIFGSGTSSFVNLTLDNSGGSVGDAQVFMLSDFTITNQLEMISGRIFDIANNKITLPAGANIVSTAGSFNATKFIRTQGYLSDGGIAKTYSSTSTSFTFPFGSGANYTPATVAFASAPTTYGTLNLKPVNAQQLYVTDPQALPYYWKVISSGFAGIPANSINLSFNYGTLPDDPAYIPGYYNFQDIAYTTINDVNAVDEGTNVISFNSFNKLDGDFTAGAPAAFGVVVPYYSRANGNWTTPSTWSNDPVLKHTGAASATIPNGSVPVFIGDGTSAFHTVTVTSNNTLAGSLIIDNGSTLDLGATTGNNFGALPYSTAGGAGKLRIASSSATAEFPAGDFGLFFTLTGGTSEYYGTSTSFTIPTVTAAPTSMEIRTYKNLVLAPSASASVTMPDRDLEVFQDLTVNGNANGVANLNDASERTLTIRNNINVTSGILRFGPTNEQTVLVDGNIVIGNAGRFDAANSGSAIHDLQLYGGITNTGTLQFNLASKAAISFIGDLSKSVSGSNASASTNFGPVVVNKGTSSATMVNIDVAGTLTAPTDSWLTLQNGTFRLSKAGSLTLTDQPASNFVIPATAALSANHVSAVLNIGMANDNDADLIVAGKLEILNGTVNVGNAANATHNDIEYSASTVAQINVSGSGTLNVNGQIRRSTSVLLGSLAYNQNGNSTVLIRGKNPEGASSFNLNRAKFEVLNAGSSFNMADNALLIIDRTGLASGTFGDLYLNPASASVTGGEVVIGTGNTPPTSSFYINSTTPFWNLKVDGTITGKTAIILGNPLVVNKDLRIMGASVLNTSGLNVTIGGELENQNTNATASLTQGGYRAAVNTQVTTFSGASSSPSIKGVSGNLTNFANVVFNNQFSGGFYNLSSNTNIRVNGNMEIQNGTLAAADNTVTVAGDVLNNAIHTTTGSGYLVMGGTAVQTINGNGSGVFGNVRMNNAAGVNLNAPATINGDINFVAGILYINNNLLTLGTAATTSGTINSSSMIRLNGVLSDGGLKKNYPASAHNFTFPIGVTLKYTPATINVTSNSVAGSVTVKPVNVKHPATTDAADKELTYYWNTSATGFNASTVVTHVYNYLQTDATNGNEANYRVGRYFGNVWVPQFGIPGSVNSTSNTMTLAGVDYFNGDYTAGEQTEFDQLLVFYSRNATLGGDWDNPTSWSTDQVLMHAGAAAATAPSFNSVIIAAGHTIAITNDNRAAATAEVNGTLNLNGTLGHNLGTVSGTGTIRMSPTISNQFIFPGGNFTAFVAAGGGTIEYFTNATTTLPSQATYNNILFSGTGVKNLFNTDLVINGNMTIATGNAVNVSNRNISLKGNLTNNSGIPGFNTGSGIVSLTGGAQTITGATQFGQLTVNGAGVKTLNSSIIVSNTLTLTSGLIATGANVVTIPSAGMVTGASAASYVFGNLQKGIATATVSKNFEIGDASAYAPLNIVFTGTTNNVGSITAFTASGDHPNAATSGIDPSKSVNRYWSIQNVGVTGFTQAAAVFNFNASDIDLGVNTSNLEVARYSSSTWSSESVGLRTATSTQVTGLTTFGEFQLAEPFSAGITWTGAVNGDWNNPGNWNPNLIPGGSDNITIPVVTNQPTFLTPGNGLVRSVVMSSGAIITIPSGYKITVNGNWTGTNAQVTGPGNVEFTSAVAQVNGNTDFRSTVSVLTGANLNTNNSLIIGNGGALMHGTGTPGAGGTVTGTIISRRTANSGALSYNYWSSPVNNSPVNVLGNNKYMYEPGSATGTDVEGLRDGWISTGTNMTNGRGYISTGVGTASFNGTANNGNISYGPLSMGTYTNFNLIGNPYPSALNAAAFVAANPQFVGGALYFWDDDNSGGNDYDQSDYGVWNGIGFVGPNSGGSFSGNIASAQGFFVETSGTASVNFSNSMRRASNSEFFNAEVIDRVWVNVTTPAGGYNELLIAFKADANDGVDMQYDAKKLRGSELAFYSKISSNDYAIQALAPLNQDKMVPLGLEAPAAGPQTITLKQVDGLANSSQIILEDTKLGTFTNLRTANFYNFNYDPASDVNRFRLHFKPAVNFTTSTESCVQNDGELIISSPSATAWNYSVSNSAGEVIAQDTEFTGNATIGNLAGGVYSINMSNSFGTTFNQVVEIASGEMVSASITASSNSIDVNDGFVQFAAQVQGASDITWDFGDGSIVTGVMTPSHIYTEAGTYTVTFIASNVNCMDVKTMEITVRDVSTGINSAGTQVFSMYPNPASTEASIRLNLPEREKQVSVFILDAAGKLVKSVNYTQVEAKSVLKLDVNDLAAGVYQILLNGDKVSSSTRLTISK
ncbi:MAG: T9SS type A sorting domain-containing protein [Bacteroidia bacterium]